MTLSVTYRENMGKSKNRELLVTLDPNSEASTECMSRVSDGRRVIQQWCGGIIQAVVDRDRVLSNLFKRM